VLTCSKADKLSREDEKWQHGAFTKVLLDALSGSAYDVDTDHNGVISMAELTAGLDQRFQGDIFVAGLRVGPNGWSKASYTGARRQIAVSAALPRRTSHRNSCSIWNSIGWIWPIDRCFSLRQTGIGGPLPASFSMARRTCRRRQDRASKHAKQHVTI
jgi:hypothetical protein